jgi:predicted nuclease with TOPRIM domain
MDKIIHIGAGYGAELHDYIASGAREIILIEPLPALASDLIKKANTLGDNSRNIHVIEVAITIDSSTNKLREFNLPGIASLRDPKGLKTLFPGLKTVAQHNVQTLTACELVQRFGPVEGETAMLVVEAPGETLSAIRSLAEADQLKRFRYINLTANPEPLYTRSGRAEEVLRVLEQNGYEQLSCDDKEPDWIKWCFRRSPLQDVVDTLTEKLKQQEKACLGELSKAQESYATQKIALQEAKSDAARQHDVTEKLKSELLKAQQDQVMILSELEENKNVLSDYRQRLEVLLAEKEESKGVLEQQQDKHQALAADLKSEMQGLQECLSQTQEALRKQTAELQSVSANEAQCQQANEKLQSELTQLQQKYESACSELEKCEARESALRDQAEALKTDKEESKGVFEQHQKKHQALTADLKSEMQGLQECLSQTQEALRKQTAELQSVHANEAQSQQANEKLQSELTQLQEKYESACSELEKREASESALRDQAEALKAEKEESKGALEQQQKEKRTAQALNAKLEDGAQALRQQISHLEQENKGLLKKQQDSEAAFGLLETRMSKMFDQQAALVQQSVSALGQHVTRSFSAQRQHFQAHSGLLAYLETGMQPLELGNWAIDADLASQLVGVLERESYDLIIEFGSGTSTLLMARVLSKMSCVTAEYALEYDSASTNRQKRHPVNAAVQQSIPQRILSFEQDGQYFRQTLLKLKQARLDSLVDLVLAPLVPTALTHQQAQVAPLFYGCEQKLMHVAQLFEGRQAKILVLVDGPVSPQKDPLTREPALANLLQYLSPHQLHIVLDDYQREGEQQVARLWYQLCEERGLRCEQQPLDTEKGALWVTTTP